MVDLNAEHYRNHSTFQYALADEILAPLKLKGDETLVDVGCGDGKITAAVSKRLPHGTVLGIDPSPSMIELAKASFPQEAFPNLHFEKAYAEAFYTDQNADILLVLNTLHWVRDPKKAIRNFATALKPGGTILILTYPKESIYWQFLDKTANNKCWEAFIDQRATKTILTTEGYRQLLQEQGFVIETCALEEKVAIYNNAQALRDYIKGWLQCYLPLSEAHESLFLENAPQNASAYSISPTPSEYHLPYSALTIQAHLS